MALPEDEVNAAIADAILGSQPQRRRVVTFGDATLRLTPPGQERLERAPMFELAIGGPEFNTAVALSAMGVDAAWVSVVPDSPMGRRVSREARANGVDISYVHTVPARAGRVGITFAEEGPDPRLSQTTVDTGNTALVNMHPGEFDWDEILDGADAFHVSGITLGLSAGARAEVMQAVKVANTNGVLVTCDLQYRPESWSESEARKAFHEIIRRVDVLFASRGVLRMFFGIDGSYDVILRHAIEKLGVAAATVTRKRAKGSRRLTLDAMAMGKSGVLLTTEARDVEVIDRSGASAAFAAGFIIGYLDNPIGLRRAVSLGAAASALKISMPGEILCASLAEVEALTED